MAIDTEVAFDYVNRIVERHGSATAAINSVNALYSFIQNTFDELTEMDDKVPMSAATPTSYKLDNGWLIREDVLQHLEGGAIETTGWTDEIHVLTLDGSYTNFVESDIGKQVQDDAVDVGALLDYDNTNKKIWVRVGSSTVIADNSAITVNGGTGAGDAAGDSVTGETLYANPYSLGTIVNTPNLYIYQDGNEIPAWWAAGHIDVLIKVMEADVNIDNRKITVFGREWGDENTSFEITLTSAGQNAVPLGNKEDSNNTTANSTVEDWQDGTISSISVDFSFSSPFQYDIGDGNGNQSYSVQIDCDGQPLSKVYEVTKYWTSENTSKTLEVDSDGNTIPGEAYRYARASYGSESVAAPFGTFAGGKFFAAQGVYFTNLHADDAQSFQLIDDNGTSRTPPNYQAFIMDGLVSGDRIAVYKSTGSGSTAVDKAQYSLSGSNGTNKITVSVAIPSSTPDSGTIIVVDDDGSETEYTYTSWSGSDFNCTISSGTYSGTETAYVPYLYATASGSSVSETSTIYTADIDVVGRVRKAGIIPYEAPGVFGSTGYKATAIRTADSIYTP